MIVGYDTVTGTVQLGSNMESTAYNAIDWIQTEIADPAHALLAFQDVPGPKMVLHNDTFYVCHMEPDDSLAPFVHYWNGASWVSISPTAALLAHYGSFTNHHFIAEYDLASDGGDLWMTFRWWEILIPAIFPNPPVYAGYLTLMRLTAGVWTFIDDQQIDTGTSLGHETNNVTATGGVAYIEMIGGNTNVQFTYDSNGITYTGVPTQPGPISPEFPSVVIVAAGGTPILLAVYDDYLDTGNHNTGWALRAYALDGTLLTAQYEIDLLGPVSSRPLNVVMGGVGDAPFVGDIYYLDLGGPVVTVSADGTSFGNVSGQQSLDWARALRFGSLAWDATDSKLWIFDAYGEPTTSNVTVRTLQRQCAAAAWHVLLQGEGALDQDFWIPDTVFHQNVKILLGDTIIVGNQAFTAVTLTQTGGANPGSGNTSNPLYNAHVQVWETTICRNCGGPCPPTPVFATPHPWKAHQ